MTRYWNLLLLLPLLALACGQPAAADEPATDDTTTDSTAATSMADMADDPAFVAIHDNPESIDFSASGELITFPTPDGATGSTYALMAEEPTDDYLFVFHEWYGLNDYIKREAERLFASLDATNVMAIDLYDGNVATNREEAQQYMQGMKEARGQAIINGALQKAGPEARIGTIGWCFGGGWSLRAAILAGEQAKAGVMYYGMPVTEAEALAPLAAPVLFIYGTQDEWINEDVANNFRDLAAANGKDLTVQAYDGQHAFANPSQQSSYNQEAAKAANRLALDFLRDNLK
jgi:carboxymethylenebutenolidase